MLQTDDKDTITITGEELSAKFVAYDKNFKTFDGYPSNEGKHNKDLQAAILADRVKEAFMILAETMVDQPLIVRTHPYTAIFAKSEVAVGKLRLSPVAKTVHLYTKKRPQPTRGIYAH